MASRRAIPPWFIVTNLSRPAERVAAFYNQRGTAEQWIKEGKNAIKWTRLSCRKFRNNELFALGLWVDVCECPRRRPSLQNGPSPS